MSITPPHRHFWPVEPGHVIIAGICLLSLIAAVLAFDQKLETWGDNAEYIILARSIVQGRWMQRINQPDSPPSDKFPFGFPLLLAGIELLQPGNMLAARIFIVALYIGAMPGVYLLMRRYSVTLDGAPSAGPGQAPSTYSGMALAVTLLTLLNPLVLSFSHQIMTEVPYLLVSVLALIGFERASEAAGPKERRAFVIALALSGLALWIRALGLAILAAVFLGCVLRREFRKGVAVGLAWLAAMAILQALGGGVIGSAYLAKVSLINPDMPELGEVGLLGLAGPLRFLGNLQKYGVEGYLSGAVVPLPAGGLVPRLTRSALRLISLGVVILLVAGWWRQRSLRQAVPLYCLCYLGLLFFTPARSAHPRYVVPLLPFFLLFLVKGFEGFVRLIGRWLRPSGLRLLRAAAFACLLALYLYTDYSVMASSPDYSPRWQSYFEAAGWLKEHAPRDSVIAGSSDHLLYLVSGRRTIGFLKSTDPQRVMAHLARYQADFVVVDGTFVTTQYLMPAVTEYPKQFELVYTARAAPTTQILRMRKP